MPKHRGSSGDSAGRPAFAHTPYSLLVITRPRIDDLEADAFEIGSIAGSQCRTSTEAHRANLGIESVDRPSGTLASYRHLRVALRRRTIKTQDLSGEAAEKLVGDRAEPRTSRPWIQAFESAADLGESDRRRHRFPGTAGQNPIPDRGIGLRSHQLGDDIGVKDNHCSKLAARGRSSRLGISSSIPPSASKRASNEQNRSGSFRWPPTASARIVRASASIERPLAAARTRSRSRTLSSRLRILSAAIASNASNHPGGHSGTEPRARWASDPAAALTQDPAQMAGQPRQDVASAFTGAPAADTQPSVGDQWARLPSLQWGTIPTCRGRKHRSSVASTATSASRPRSSTARNFAKRRQRRSDTSVP